MPTAIDGRSSLTRRAWLERALAASLGAWTWPAHATAPAGLWASWQGPAGHALGWLEIGADRWRVRAQTRLPGRAHGLLPLPDGGVIAAARRPGDWLLHWHPGTGASRWHWVAGDRRLNGHLAPGNEAEAVFLSTETDLETGGGRVVWRALQDLEIRAEWDAGGVDPHQALVLPQACGNLPAGTVMVALGGVCQQLETGRSKPMQGRPLQSSLVALEPELGRMLGRWRLSDPWLSIRHLAWDALSGRLGVALQSEHPDPLVRAQAPVLAVWQGTGWEMAVDQPPLMGYAGGIEACPGGGFVVSCPRGNALAWFDAAARWQRSRRLDRACPLAWVDQQLWAGGGAHAHSLSPAADARRVAGPARLGELQFDNHWVRCL